MPSIGDVLEWTGAAFAPAPPKVCGHPTTGAPGLGALLVSNGTQWGPVVPTNGIASNGATVTLETTYAANSLAGTGLAAAGGQLSVNALAIQGNGLSATATQLSVDCTSVAASLAGSGLAAAGSHLDVNPTSLAGTALISQNGNTRLGVDVTALTNQIAGTGMVAAAGRLDVNKAANVPQLGGGAALADVINTVNAIITNLRNAGLMQ